MCTGFFYGAQGASQPKMAVSDRTHGSGNSVVAEIDDKAADRDRLQAELTLKKISELKKQALAEGIDQQAIELVDDSDNPREALICLLLEALHWSTSNNVKDQAEQLASLAQRLRLELQPMRISALRKRAAEAGASADEVEEATDAENSKVALIELIVGYQNQGEDQTKQREALRVEALRLELQRMRISALRKRAAEAGASANEVDTADDCDAPKAALIELVIRKESAQAAAVEEEGVEVARRVEALRVELQATKVSDLRRRAAAAGASTSELDTADDSDLPKAALIELVISKESVGAEPEMIAGVDESRGQAPGLETAQVLQAAAQPEALRTGASPHPSMS
jgi:hypothetical protein